MGVMETKIIQVQNDPAVLNRVNEVWGSFGWSVLSVQVTHTQNTKTYTNGAWDYYSGDKTVETTTINYATVTYQRDKGMDNYQEIAALESRFNEEMGKLNLIEAVASPSVWLVLVGFVILEWIVASFAVKGGKITAYLGTGIAAIAYVAYQLKKSGERYQQREQNKNTKAQIETTLDQIRAQAAQLV